MSDINVVALTGRLGRDPETRSTQAGTAVANVSLAVSRRFKSKDGQSSEDTTWVRLVFWDKLAELAGRYLTKGSQIAVRGELQERSWEDQSGQKRTMTEVRVHDLTLLGGKQERGEAAPSAKPKAAATAGFDDEIPF